MLSMIKSGGKKIKIAEVVQFVTAYGGLAYASSRAGQYAAAAKTNIAALPDSPAKQSLAAFAEFVVQRDK
jgi:geranylgeranyl pyrophosphate synthase